MPELFDNNSIEQWQADGRVEVNERALMRVRALVARFLMRLVSKCNTVGVGACASAATTSALCGNWKMASNRPVAKMALAPRETLSGMLAAELATGTRSDRLGRALAAPDPSRLPPETL